MISTHLLTAKAQAACLAGDLLTARQWYLQALTQKKNQPAALHGLGVIAIQQQQPLRAVVLLERCYRIQRQAGEPTDSIVQALLYALNASTAQALHQRQWTRAISLGHRALEFEPQQAHTLSNLAVACLRTNRLKEALAHSQAACKLQPDQPQVLNNQGTVLQELGLLEEASVVYATVLNLDPQHGSALANLASVAQQQGRLAEAETLYRRHLQSFADDTRVWVNLAGVLLCAGQWHDGWHAYERRLDDPSPIMSVPPKLARWKGPDQSVRQLVVVHEQGLGDSFQFSRYLPLLRQCGSVHSVVFSGPQKLHGLLRKSGLVQHCWDPNDPSFDWDDHTQIASDAWIPLMSLAPMLQTSAHFNHQPKPYLKASPHHLSLWMERLQTSRTPLIALHWQGNPDHEFTLSRGRSIPLKQLEPLWELKGLQWLSVQKGPGSEQCQTQLGTARFHPNQALVDACWSFEETAAILMCCDLVITSDSGLAHLAAGLGRPTWLMLMHIPEWRWGLSGAHTPWYPSMRLFRQRKRGDWQGLVQEQIQPALKQWHAAWLDQQG